MLCTPLDGDLPQRDLEPTAPFDAAAFETAIHDLLLACGVPPSGKHTGKTPQRVREMWQNRLLDGYAQSPETVLGEGFADDSRDMVIIRDIAIHGICPHHLIPFHGLAHVAYLPGGRLHGFGRISRMVDVISHRMTYQEWMTRDIADTLLRAGQARGVACVVDAQQLCLLLGENRRGSERVVTQAFAGAFEDDTGLQNRFLTAIRQA
ncbi:GTP cyclohydrolase I FolE [Paludibacterium paludis]|uniref:GTP cyclohydrolase 1 n=1 Tax=Paludibacterium paludis TaxID=1225769 RepID=A0A918UAK4_9NEIS|nr:GTP cyclohydrolase I FolE [Paludibacterium paludis]GGY17360.1 GTP cyclohydrolase 1 [Paludibacterium paludis]